MKIQQNPTTNQLFTNLPIELCKSMGIKKGTKITFRVEDKKTIIVSISD